MRAVLRASRPGSCLHAKPLVTRLIGFQTRAFVAASGLNASSPKPFRHVSSGSRQAPSSGRPKRATGDRPSSLVQVIAQVRAVVTADRQIPDLNSFVRAAETTGLSENRAKVYRDCVISIIAAFKTSTDDWNWIRGWASRSPLTSGNANLYALSPIENNLTPKLIYESAITYHTATPPEDASPAVATTTLLLLYAAGVHMSYVPALLSFAHLTILSGSHPSTMNIFSESHAAFARLLRTDDPDALTIEAKYKLGSMSNGEEAKRLLARALKTGGAFEWRPMALVLLARVHIEDGDVARARQLLEQAISESDYSIAHDDLAELGKSGSREGLDMTPQETVAAALNGRSTGLRSLARMFMGASVGDTSEAETAFYSKAMENMRFARDRLV
ncbi:Tetratricopeptide-like helical [Ceratocystis lukuohia]|uniref:Tetratricopeptide-like helical n=1 Tax=Ceratocystis lukuohia TaxID=2019550 RepID=A0ABR4MBH2_9PEZI